MKFGTLALAMAATVSTAGPASAALITKTYNLVATGFASDPGVPPYATVTGSFTVTFDNSAYAADQTSIIVNSLSIPYQGSVRFDYLASTTFWSSAA